MIEVVPVVIGALGCICWSDAEDCIVGNCEDIEKSVGDVKKRIFY